MSTPQLWSVVVPVKRPEFAKTRLAEAVGEHRAGVARAFAADTVDAVLACSVVESVTVVTDDDETAEQVRLLGARTVPDSPDAGLNAALRHGVTAIRSARPAAAVATLSADLPALRAAELHVTLVAASEHPVAFLADASGIGTTVYTSSPGSLFEPRFGGRSRAAHRAAGAVELELGSVPSVRRDVDTAVDLWDAARLGLGTRTKTVVDQLGVAF